MCNLDLLQFIVRSLKSTVSIGMGLRVQLQEGCIPGDRRLDDIGAY
jgi:hypothetical protein